MSPPEGGGAEPPAGDGGGKAGADGGAGEGDADAGTPDGAKEPTEEEILFSDDYYDPAYGPDGWWGADKQGAGTLAQSVAESYQHDLEGRMAFLLGEAIYEHPQAPQYPSQYEAVSYFLAEGPVARMVGFSDLGYWDTEDIFDTPEWQSLDVGTNPTDGGWRHLDLLVDYYTRQYNKTHG
ncbi:hypothetical protein C1Y63_04755 [Corynebacterium sp. 13CS0277]|uniref:hypothetical protein n=1 Tax=Corynebacterium sp. 13CS0277 TaxID=2071994 RepID=UPI000D037231|nr:hypothetical protein [Corynebacterium sp. 13CS0277]PRQ11721.1 hypothetical protein C1Y63_04755 [Corynebacterium sp. 13CS0277]